MVNYFRQISILRLFLFISITNNIFAQHIAINNGIDTTDLNIKTVIKLWTNYLNSNPNKDNIKDSPYWANTEKEKYPKVDQLLNSINSEIPTYLMGQPTILYVKPKHDFFEIKTLFSTIDSLEHVYALCITSVFAKKENEQYRLYNALTVNSSDWKSEKIESVTFHFSSSYTFNETEANKLIRSIHNLTKQWELQTIPIDYYFANTYEEIQHLRGLDYFIGMGNRDKPSGMSDPEARTVFAGGLGENYFHEVVHIYLNNLFPKSPIVEGLAVFYGGSLGHDLKWHLARLNDYLNQHPEINLNDFENYWYMDNFTNPNSTLQGLLCHIAYQQGGLNKLKKLASYENIYIAIEKELGVNKDGIDHYLRQQLQLNKD